MASLLRRASERSAFWAVLYNVPRLLKGYQPIFLDYRVRPVPRYGYGKAPHPELSRILAAHDEHYAAALAATAALAPDLLRIPLRAPEQSPEPCWINNWLEGLDTAALYSMVVNRNAALHVEIGSGYSTKVVRRAIRDHQLRTRLVSIDPQPRAAVDPLCDEVVRQPLENCDPGVFSKLRPGDTLFFDGSHRTFMNSDVTVFFLEILPRLSPGVCVHMHDIYLPLDYPPDRAHWYYSEQYLLAASLLAGHANYEVVLPNHYVANTPALSRVLAPLWSAQLAEAPRGGTSFWLETR